MTALIVVEGVALLLLALLVVGLLRSHAEILRALHRMRDRACSARDQRLHQLWRRAKRRLALRRIQHGHAPAGACACINQAPTLAHPRHNRVHRSCNRRNLLSHRDRDFAVFAVDQRDNFARHYAVKVS